MNASDVTTEQGARQYVLELTDRLRREMKQKFPLLGAEQIEEQVDRALRRTVQALREGRLNV